MTAREIIEKDVVSELVGEMVKRGVNTIFPSQAIGVFRNKDIRELIIDEEGTVFIQFVDDLDSPVMIPMFVEINDY